MARSHRCNRQQCRRRGDFSGKVALFALIPIAIGLHYLIYYSVIGKKEAAALEAERRAKTA